MTPHKDPWSRFAELPTKQLELSGKLSWSTEAPVIKLRPDPVSAAADKVPSRASGAKRSNYETRTYHAWVIYPHVVCTPIPDLEVLAKVETPRESPAKLRHVADLPGVAELHHFFKLSRLGGQPLTTPWGCEVRYGPWFGVITCIQQCDGGPDYWMLSSSVLAMQVEWWGTADDIPQVPNLHVVWSPNGPSQVRTDCCGGYTFCATTGGCLSNSITCQPPIPL